MKNKEYNQHLFLKVLEGETLSSAEQADLIDWLHQNPEDQSLLSELSDVWVKLDTNRELSDELINEKWNQLQSAIQVKLAKDKTQQRLAKWKGLQKYAAVFILGVLVAASLIVGLPLLNNNQVHMQSVEVPLGAKSVIQLADGSEVVLNAGSKLKYHIDFGQNKREVFLDGEAFFKVAKNPQMPFLVNTSNIVVRAYGTAFNVKAYPTDPTIEATLVEGVISVQKRALEESVKAKEYFLEPKQQVTYHKPVPGIKKEKLFISKSIDPDIYMAWVNDQIQARSFTLEELAVILERKYNVTIHIENKELRTLKFSGTLENETIEQVLKAIQLASPVQFKIKNREIWLTK